MRISKRPLNYYGLAAALGFCLGCAGYQPLPASEPCEGMCTTLDRLNCDGWFRSPGVDEIEGTADDDSCLSVCNELETNLAFKPPYKCLTAAQSCDDLPQCYEVH